MPYYVIETMGNIPGLTGLFVAGIFSASLSTISAALNSLAAIAIEDYIKVIYLYICNINASSLYYPYDELKGNRYIASQNIPL